jgi:hypothetical protein
VRRCALPATSILKELPMKAVNMVALILMIIGGLNWGLVGLFNVDLVATLFGAGTTLARLVYVLVGLAALWGFALIAPLSRDVETRIRA